MAGLSVRIIVTGRVQGVGFRQFVREEARRLGLAGSVTNRAGGEVEILARGPVEAVEQLEAAARTGPRGARVSELIRSYAASQDSFSRPFR